MRFLVLVVLTLLASGCASSWTAGRRYTPRDNTWGLGYSETQIASDTWRVTYDGYQIPQSQAEDYAMLRAAELTLNAGYSHFLIVGQSATSQPGAAAAIAISPTMAVGVPTSRPEATLTIRAVKAGEGNALDAAFVARSFRAKYKIAAL